MNILLICALCVAAVAASPSPPEKIVGGSLTTIQEYPFAAVLLMSFTDIFYMTCGGAVINNRSILTAAHCLFSPTLEFYRARVGSSYAHSGGQLLELQSIITHPGYYEGLLDYDVGIIRMRVSLAHITPLSIAGSNYNLADSTSVTAIGWGQTEPGGSYSEQLRHVVLQIVNQEVCRRNYAELGNWAIVTNNMLCSGWINEGGRDQCYGDSGSPLLHNRVAVGICSWGESCALPRFPGVNTRVSVFSNWITQNA